MKTFTGLLATFGVVGTVTLQTVNEVLTCISITVGIAVGVASFISIIKKK